MTLYRVIQEGLTDVHKHASASQARITLDFGIQAVSLELTDNGSGFDVAAWETRENQLIAHGLIGLQERLSLVGGTLCITSGLQGTKLAISIPQGRSQVSFNGA